MKVTICYPPIHKSGKVPLLGQNRQFRFSSSNEVRIYPIVPSIAATMLAESGFDVQYVDGINERISWEVFVKDLHRFGPDLIVMETKTPAVKIHWEMINNLKRKFSDTMFVLMGDHVSYLPKESLLKSDVDFVITGGDYDVSLLGIAEYLEGYRKTLPNGVWHHRNGKIINTGSCRLISDLDHLPFINRKLTKWYLYGEAYLYHPCTYIMWGRGCYPGKCGFCVWSSNLWSGKPRLRSVENVLDEIELLTERLNVKEIFDDTDTSTWNRRWILQFCKGMIKRKLNDDVYISCNARGDNLDRETCKLMKKAGFRLLKVGLESGNDQTLIRINKGETVKQVVDGVKNAKDAGLNVLLTIMVGYPWEAEEDIKQTFTLAKQLMLYKTHIGDSLQASIIVPYPGTPLYFQAIKNGWFMMDPCDYEKFDMDKPVLRTPIPSKRIGKLCGEEWRIHLDPRFVLKTMSSIRSLDDVYLLTRGVKSVLGHIKDFK